MERSNKPSDTESGPASGLPNWMGKKVARFKLVGVLGRGAMGKVFRAEDTTLHRQVALKTLPKQFRTSTHTITADQLIREARSAAAIEHPNVVQIYEAGEANGIYYIAMELLEGGTIHSLVKGAGPLDPVRACQIGAEAAEALDYAHQLGIVHRDVKPSNLMLTRSGRCKVVDFGLARVEDANGRFVPLGETVGTAYFLAPEVIGGAPATAQSDIYSLAATLYLLLTGDAPYIGDSKAEVLNKHLSQPVPNLLEVRPDIPESLVKVITRGMSKRPEDRFESAGQFAKALRVHTIPIGTMSGSFVPQAAGSGPVNPPPAAPSPKPAKDPRKMMLAIGGAAAGLIVLVVVVIAIAHGHSTPASNGTPPPPQASNPNATPAAHTDKLTPPVEAKPPVVPPATATTGIVDAADTATLLRIAGGEVPGRKDKRVIVEGTPRSASLSSTGKVFRIEFTGTDGSDGLIAVYFPGNDMFARMDRKFGKNSSSLLNQKIRLRGDLEIYQSRPEIRINTPDQVEIVK